jgi:hypothetical protein
MSRFACSLVLLVACADAGDGLDTSAENTAPLIGVDGSADQADRNCHVVLRDLSRNSTGISWETAGSSWVWSGAIEISDAAASEGLVPSAMYHLAPNGPWSSVDATPVTAPATPGYARFMIRLDHDLPGPGWSGTSLSHVRLEVVPYLRLPQGGRLFDHNRNPRDLDNYVASSPEIAIGNAPTVCMPPAGPTRARLVFDASFHQHRDGVLAPGGELVVAYDQARLAQCRNSQAGHPLYDITAHVVFSPGQERRDVSVRDGAPTVTVPAGARSVALWFENTSSSGCQAWDSNFGNNYVFDVFSAHVPPQWFGEMRTLITRDGSDACDGGVPAQQGFHFDTWARQRAYLTNACFQVYQPGTTDRDDPDLWQKLDVAVHWRYVGQPAWQTQAVNFDRRSGNNARYAFSLRDLDPLRTYHCPEVAPTPTSDGQYAQIQFEYYVTVNGGELRPAPGVAYTGTFTDYKTDAWRSASCP